MRPSWPAQERAAIAAFAAGSVAWREALVKVDGTGPDMVGYRTYPHGSDPEERCVDIVWWVNQELPHYGAEIALLRDLYRAQRD